MKFFKFTISALDSVQESLIIAMSYRHKKVLPWHLLLAILTSSPSAFRNKVPQEKLSGFIHKIEEKLQNIHTDSQEDIDSQLLSYEIIEVIDEAEKIAEKQQKNVTHIHLIEAMIRLDKDIAQLFKEFEMPASLPPFPNKKPRKIRV